MLCHALENSIAEKLTAHLFKYNLLSTNLFGFMPNRSTCFQLLIALNKWYKSFDDAIDIDIIYTDILKAFDTVSHSKLISVLQSYRVCNNVLNWITSFISYRKQCVCINDTISSFCDITCGVPQESVLGPLLFVVYIDNLVEICQPSNIRGDLHLYANDAKVYSSNAQELQNSLNNIISWLATHQLALAPTKCEHLSIKRKNHATQHEYYIDNTAVCSVSTVRNLGIITVFLMISNGVLIFHIL